MGKEAQQRFRRLAEPIVAKTLTGQDVRLETGRRVSLVSGHRVGTGELIWRLEDRTGTVYRVNGRL